MNNFVEAVKEMDGFSHTQFLRYRQEDSYRTFLGGCTTISLIILFIGMFANMIIDTIGKNIISGSTTKVFQMNPQPYEIEISPQNKFMMAFSIVGLNMSDTKRYFDLTFEKRKWTGQAFSNENNSFLQFGPCKKQQWAKMGPQIGQAYDNLGMSGFLCFQSDQKLQLQGRWSSKLMKLLQVSVRKCTNGSIFYPNTTCVSQDQLKQFVTDNGDFAVAIYFINTNINLQSQDYLHHYIEEKNWIYFNLNQASYAQMYLSEYHIETDSNLVPWKQASTQSGIFMDSLFIQNIQRKIIHNDTYFQIHIIKSEFRYDSTRAFRKIDETLSYIGGLYGAVLILFIFLSFYSKYGYEIQFADRIFRKNDYSSYGSENFSFITFLSYSIFNVLSILGVNLKWKEMRQYHQCRLQSLKQLDLNLLFKKVQFFSEISTIIMEDYHLAGLHFFPKKTIQQSQNIRRNYLVKGLIYNQIDKKSKEINVQKKQYKQHFQKCINQLQIQKNIGSQKQFHMGGHQKQKNQEQSNKMSHKLQKLKKTESQGDPISKKIINRMKLSNEEIFPAIIESLKYIQGLNLVKRQFNQGLQILLDNIQSSNNIVRKLQQQNK